MKPTFLLFHAESVNENRDSVCHLILVPVVEGNRQEPIEFFFDPKAPFLFVMSGISENKVLSFPTFDTEWPKVQDILNKYDTILSSADGNSARTLWNTLNRLDIKFDKFEYCNAKSILTRAWDEGSYSFDFLNFKHYKDTILDSEPVEIAIRWSDLVVKALSESDQSDIKTYAAENRIKFGSLSNEEFVVSKCMKTRYDKTFDASSINVIEDVNNPFCGKTVVFTGKLQRMPRNTARGMVVEVGGLAPDRLTQETNYLVVGDQDLRVVGESGLSGKMKKAAQYKEKGCDIEIINERDFFEMFND